MKDIALCCQYLFIVRTCSFSKVTRSKHQFPITHFVHPKEPAHILGIAFLLHFFEHCIIHTYTDKGYCLMPSIFAHFSYLFFFPKLQEGSTNFQWLVFVHPKEAAHLLGTVFLLSFFEHSLPWYFFPPPQQHVRPPAHSLQQSSFQFKLAPTA